MIILMLAGRFFLEISPGQILYAEGPWTNSSSDAEWEIAILPFKPLSSDSPRFLNARQARIISREELSQCGKTAMPPVLSWKTSNQTAFHTSFQELQSLIAQGKAQKGVPWAFQTAALKNARSHWENLLTKATQVSSSLTLYGAEMEEESVVGATPEWLFRIEKGGHTLHTLALAGTRWVNQVRPESQEKKDALEHRLVVEDIQQNLKRFGRVHIGEMSWLKAGSVEHLHTPIRLEADEVLDPVELLRVLHPTPAVGVFPRTEAAMNWLHNLPGHESRADFAAPWVVRHRQDGSAWALVALRQVRLRGDEVFIPAGCGVIEASVEEVEWKEIQEKIRSVKQAWGLADSPAL